MKVNIETINHVKNDICTAKTCKKIWQNGMAFQKFQYSIHVISKSYAPVMKFLYYMEFPAMKFQYTWNGFKNDKYTSQKPPTTVFKCPWTWETCPSVRNVHSSSQLSPQGGQESDGSTR